MGVLVKKMRKDCFIGVHFDFHAGQDCSRIGKGVTEKLIEDIIRIIKPDFIQCDCKGHPGYSSYPTKVGNPAPGFVKDQLKIWRRVTAKHGILLFVHYSGVVDELVCKTHPSWAAYNLDSKPDRRATSVFSPYVDKLMIPQLKELITDYGIDGVWVDGDCWGVELDYSPRALKIFKQQTGIVDVPKDEKDRFFFEFVEFNRDGFRKYLKHYVEELHRYHPGFEIGSNWAFARHMPEPVSVNVDFISGDYMPSDALNSARFDARLMRHQGKPWDLMAWSFTFKSGIHDTKSVIQLCQEASVVISLGGKFQAYLRQTRTGSVEKWPLKVMGATADFCRIRKHFCTNAEAVPQVGIIFSTSAHYKESPRVFRPGELLHPVKGILQVLLDANFSVDILLEHKLLNENINWPCLVVPEWEWLPVELIDRLVEYVKEGGKLIVIGADTCRLFDSYLKLKTEIYEKRVWLEFNERLTSCQGKIGVVKCFGNKKTMGRLFETNDIIGKWYPAAYIVKIGKGYFAAVGIEIGDRYCKRRTFVIRDFVRGLVKSLFQPMVELDKIYPVDIVINRRDNEILVHMINTAGPHDNESVSTFDIIPEIRDIGVSVRVDKPSEVKIQPSGEDVKFKWERGILSFNIPVINVHSIIQIKL